LNQAGHWRYFLARIESCYRDCPAWKTLVFDTALAVGHNGLREKLLAHRQQIRLTSLGLFKATQIWALH
jgi:hypothetical protein